jgi:hypothetical protein
MDLSIKGGPEEQVKRLRERAKANHRSLQGELRALIEEAAGIAPRRLTARQGRMSIACLMRRLVSPRPRGQACRQG